jgi:trypsin
MHYLFVPAKYFIFLTFLLALLLASPTAQGNQVPSAKIIGGQKTSAQQWPFLVGLAESLTRDARRGFICGGALLDRRTVLTAAHCVWKNKPKYIDVVWGRSNLRGRSGHRVAVGKIKTHPHYSENTLSNDLALLQIKKPLPRTNIVVLDKAPEAGTVLQTAGWGQTSSGYPSWLREASVSTLSDKQCQDHYGNINNTLMFCAEGRRENPCTKDSGGPLVEKTSSEVRLYGVVSWGDVDCRNSPTVYARPDVSWIERARWRR